MRNALLVALALTTVGCDYSFTGFDHQSVLFVETQGVALNHDGEQGMAGMYDISCVFTTDDAAITDDYDMESDEEEVEDSSRRDDLETVLVSTKRGLHFLTPYAGWQSDIPHLPLEGVRDARLASNEAVALHRDAEGCHIRWMRSEVSVTVDDSVCEAGEMTIDRVSGTVFVSTSDATLAVTRDGATELAPAASLLAWDPTHESLYLAQGDLLTAVSLDGEELWSTAALGDVAAMTTLGQRGELAVMADGAFGAELSVLGGSDGLARLTMATPSAADALVASGQGDRLAVILPHEVHFFGVEADL